MIDLLFVALFQAAAGAPQTTAPTDPTAQTAPAAQTAPSGDQNSSSNSNSNTHDEGVRCQAERHTGTMMARRTCTTREQRRQHEEDAQHKFDGMNYHNNIVNRAGAQPQ